MLHASRVHMMTAHVPCVVVMRVCRQDEEDEDDEIDGNVHVHGASAVAAPSMGMCMHDAHIMIMPCCMLAVRCYMYA